MVKLYEIQILIFKSKVTLNKLDLIIVPYHHAANNVILILFWGAKDFEKCWESGVKGQNWWGAITFLTPSKKFLELLIDYFMPFLFPHKECKVVCTLHGCLKMILFCILGLRFHKCIYLCGQPFLRNSWLRGAWLADKTLRPRV